MYLPIFFYKIFIIIIIIVTVTKEKKREAKSLKIRGFLEVTSFVNLVTSYVFWLELACFRVPMHIVLWECAHGFCR